MKEIILDLPYPPSVNSIWRRSARGMRLSDEYRRWLDAADACVHQGGGAKRLGRLTGKFEAHITLDKMHPRPGDIDNRIKATLDFAQRIELIADDKHCQRLVIERGAAPEGCRLVLREAQPDNFVSIGAAANGVVEKLREKMKGQR